MRGRLKILFVDEKASGLGGDQEATSPKLRRGAAPREGSTETLRRPREDGCRPLKSRSGGSVTNLASGKAV